MSLSVFLAWLIGPLNIVIGLAILMNRNYYRDMVAKFMTDPQDYYFSGVAAFVIGMAIVVTHNIWVVDWPVLITLTGWGSLLKGSVRLLFPAFGKNLFQKELQSHSYLVLSGAILIPMGLWLTWGAWVGNY